MSDKNEIEIKVPSIFLNYPLGFVIDAGGSVAKLIYRSREDYKNCIPIQSNRKNGVLRLRYFPISKHDEILDFIQGNVDICNEKYCNYGNSNVGDYFHGNSRMQSADDSTNDFGGAKLEEKNDNVIAGVNKVSDRKLDGAIKERVDGEKNGIRNTMDSDKNSGAEGSVWWQTGICVTHFKKKLESTFKIKTKMLSEMLAISKFPILLESSNFFDRVPTSKEAVEFMAFEGKQYLHLVNTWIQMGEKSLAQLYDEKDEVTKLTDLVMESKIDEILFKLNSIKIQFPCIFLLCGSAFPIIRLEADGSSRSVDFSTIGGKTFQALGEELTGAKNFDDLISMAQRGDSEKVDVSCGDLKNADHEEDDWYNPMPSQSVVFNLGKLSKHNVFQRGCYSKEDVAAGYVSMFCEQTAKWALLNAQVQRVDHIVFAGSFVADQYVRRRLERCCLVNAFLASIEKDKRYIHSHFVSNPGFISGLGVWIKNLEDRGQPSQ